jgi:hypothetical protein
MAGFKRGGARGGSAGAFKKASAKKRAGSDDEDSVPRTSKKSKSDDEESNPFMPELKTDDDDKPFVGVRMLHQVDVANKAKWIEAQCKRQAARNCQRVQRQFVD